MGNSREYEQYRELIDNPPVIDWEAQRERERIKAEKVREDIYHLKRNAKQREEYKGSGNGFEYHKEAPKPISKSWLGKTRRAKNADH
ncbi:TPA: hypothetical protein OUD88_002886 [Enterobacter hormaechei]|nr:hypothetical protein [Enterobacter hormaechei]